MHDITHPPHARHGVRPAMTNNSDVRATLPPVRIRNIVAAPLFGESPKGGWSAEIRPEDSIHALIAVHTDAGITGYGSVFTDGRLVQAALPVLEPLFRGELFFLAEFSGFLGLLFLFLIRRKLLI